MKLSISSGERGKAEEKARARGNSCTTAAGLSRYIPNRELAHLQVFYVAGKHSSLS